MTKSNEATRKILSQQNALLMKKSKERTYPPEAWDVLWARQDLPED